MTLALLESGRLDGAIERLLDRAAFSLYLVHGSVHTSLGRLPSYPKHSF